MTIGCNVWSVRAFTVYTTIEVFWLERFAGGSLHATVPSKSFERRPRKARLNNKVNESNDYAKFTSA